MKKHIAFALAALLLLLAACTQTPDDASQSDAHYFEAGGFIEYDITPPEMTGETHAVFFGEDGYIGLVTGFPAGDYWGATSWHHYTSSDGGKSWEIRDTIWTENYLFTMENQKAKGTYIRQLLPMENGELLAAMHDIAAQTDKVVTIGTDGWHPVLEQRLGTNESIRSIEIDGYFGHGNILYTIREVREDDTYGNLYVPIDRGLHNVNTDTQVLSMGASHYTPHFKGGDKLYVQQDPAAADAWVEVDLQSATQLETTVPEVPANLIAGTPQREMLAADENAIVYSIGSHGFMRYNNETGEIDQLFGSEGFTFQTMLQGVVAARVVNETELFLATRTSGGGKVLRYVYDADKPDTRPNTLRVYALRGSETLKLAEQVFEARYQDTNMVLETYFAPPALSDVPAAPDIAARPAATDIDEAAEQLITRVLAGEGPDVIIMDDLPYSAYARQGLFEDVADLAESSGVAVFITDSLRDENGKLPLVPSHFSFPVLLGDLEDNTPNSLDELVNGVLARPTFTQAFPDWQLVTLEESDRPQVHFNTLDEISIVLLRANLSAVLPGMTRVDGENVEKLLLAVQRVAQHYDLQNQPNMGMPLYGIYVEYLFTDRYMPSGVTAMAQGGAGQYWGKMDTFQLLRTVYSGRPIIPYPPGTSKRENYKSGFYGAALPTLAQAVYTPINLMGINVDANNKEGARAFVELMLSKEMQTPNLYEGLPVTMAAMEQQYDDAMRINDMFSLEDAVLEPEEEVIFNYEAIFAELEYPYEYFPALEDAFIQQAQLYCTGAITIQQAVSEIESAMELYLQERYNG